MIYGKEITVLVHSSYDELNKALLKNGFNAIETYSLKDIYMIKKNIDVFQSNYRNILKNCILVRNVIGIEKILLYKHKKYDEQSNILEEGKVECPIEDVDKAVEFMKTINYKVLMNINDECTVYSNNSIELVVQKVNDKHIFIEMEDSFSSSDIIFDSTINMINEINKYNLPIKKDNYFVSKAEIILKEQYGEI